MAIIALDPSDPFTGVSVTSGSWNYSYVDRTTVIKRDDGNTYADGD